MNRSTRWVLVAGAVAALLAGLSLFALTRDTETWFAWTISPPITAAVLGAGFLGSMVLALAAAPAPAFAGARIAVIATLCFGVMMLAVTLAHLDRFHTDQATGRVWIAVYLLVPAAFGTVLVLELRAGRPDPPRARPMSTAIRSVLGLDGTALVALGTALLAAPVRVGSVWPWTLTPLTARAIGVFAAATGILSLLAAWEGDWVRARPRMLGCGAFFALQLVAVARFGDALDASDAAAWVYLAYVSAALVLAAVGAVLGLRPPAPGRAR